MKRYKITVTTIQGHNYFYCCWKMGGKYNLRLVILHAECIFYMEDELPMVTELLKINQEKLQIKTYSINEITHKPHSIKASKQPYPNAISSDAWYN